MTAAPEPATTPTITTTRTPTVRLRTFVSQVSASQRLRLITIFHAGYRTNNRLLDLPALDALDQDGQTQHGFDHRTALTVCGIIADNAWDGYFTRTRAGARIMLDDDPVLMEAEYYFHVPRPSRHHSDQGQQEQEEDQQQEQGRHEDGQGGKDEYRYPVVPSFKHWRFPHSCLPPGWPQSSPEETDGAMAMQAVSISSASQAVRDRDGSCRLSGFGDQIERAHLCPRSEVEWFLDQDMDRYNNSRSLMGNNVVDDLSNSLALRVDIHQSFDARNFVFVPKQDRWTAHFIANTRTLGTTYHNKIVDLDSAVHPCFLLTRLAWAVLPMVANFLLRGHVRRVTIKQPQATSSTSTTSTHKIQDMTKHDLLAMLNPPRARSQSPKKRDRPTELDNDNDSEDGDDAENDNDMVTGPRKRIRHDSNSRLPSQTPNLSSTVSIPSSSSSSPENPTHERRRLAALRHSALLHQRPSLDRRHLICCDYSAAERDSAAGLIGSKEWDGAFLCWECLGGTRTKETTTMPTSTPEDAV